MSDAPSLERLQELFDRISEMPAEEREAEIVRCSADDPRLAQELRALLDHAARTDSPLDTPTLRLGEAIEPPLPQIAGFRVRRRIGRGGSSNVYLADQQRADFARAVALKVVDRVFDEVSLRSVREESRILARLEHPGIARLYDTGVTSSGQPWLAIEYVEGQTILEHCRSNRLSLRARLELFLSVLDAVAYAHAKGIVHRDLKPANIFVTKGGEVRLLDFGIAKFCDPADRDETRTFCRALTPAYASPEQIRGERTTIVSDIYSLGIVLYELLAGIVPKDARSAGRDDGDTDAPLASAAFVASGVNVAPVEADEWRRALRGDIDAILAKALRERPEERYATATALAADLRRVLDGTRVTVRREHLTRRAVTFVRHHRVAIAISFIVVLFAASWEIAGRRDQARTTQPNSELAIYRDTPKIDPETRRWLVDGADKLARFDAAGARASFLQATKSSRGRVPDEALAWDGVSRAESSLGEIGRSADAARRAATLLGAAAGTLPPHEVQRLRARAYAANRDWNRAITTLEALFSTQPARVDIGIDLATTLLACGRTDAAETIVGRLRQLAPRQRSDDPGDDPRIDLLEAEVALQSSEFQRAAAAAIRARDRANRLQAVALSRRAARVHGEAIGRMGRREEARRELEQIAADDARLGLAREAAVARLALGPILLRDNSAGALRVLEEALAGCTSTDDRRCAILARSQLAILAGRADRSQDAIREARAAVADARAIHDRWAEGYALAQLLTVYNWADDDAGTHATADETLMALRESGNRALLMSTLTNLAILANEALELEKAETYLVEAEGLARRVGSQIAYASIDRARGYLEERRGDHDLARKSYTSAVERARRAGVPMSVANYLSDLAWLELADDRPAPAAERAKEAIAAYESVGDMRAATETEGVLAWAEARMGNVAAARQRLEKLRKLAGEDGSPRARFDLLVIEARVAAAVEDWKRVIELRRETVRMAQGWNAQGLVVMQQAHLAEALHRAGERRALEKLVREMLPVAEQYGLRGITRDMRALLASSSVSR